LPSLDIRRATLTDVDVLMSILDAAAERHGRRPWLRSLVERGIAEDETVVGCEQGRAVATATLQRSDPDVWGPDALVAPAAFYLHRLASLEPGRGLGSATLAGAEEWATAAGAEVLRLDCGADNPRLRRYYRDLGYAELEEVELPGWRLVRFEKCLPHASVQVPG
jgi:GNAT superfamily N-acetyltransferase